MLPDKLVLIFQHTYRQAQLRDHPLLALADPPGMGLVYGEDLLPMRNHFALAEWSSASLPEDHSNGYSLDSSFTGTVARCSTRPTVL